MPGVWERRSSLARLELPLLDPRVAREVGIVASDLLDEALGVLAADERVDGITEWARVARQASYG